MKAGDQLDWDVAAGNPARAQTITRKALAKMQRRSTLLVLDLSFDVLNEHGIFKYNQKASMQAFHLVATPGHTPLEEPIATSGAFARLGVALSGPTVELSHQILNKPQDECKVRSLFSQTRPRSKDTMSKK